jgi:hypothetical protein
VSTKTDEIVTPQPRAGLLDGARQIAVQDICPGRYVEHGEMTSDAVAFALVRDAIDHPGPADPARIDRAVCKQVTIPGTSPTKTLDDVADLTPGLIGFYAQAVPHEPPVRCAFDAACPKRRLTPDLTADLVRTGGPSRRTIVTTGMLRLPPGAEDQCAGTVRVEVTRGRTTPSRRQTSVGRDCTFTVRVRLGRSVGRRRVTVRYEGDAELEPASARPLRIRG